jgi:hypothetical protein
VESVAAIGYYLSRGATRLPWMTRGFGNALGAASCTGQVAVIKRLLVQLDNDIDKMGPTFDAVREHSSFSQCNITRDVFDQAIDPALLTGNPTSALLLIQYQPGYLHGAHPTLWPSSWISPVMRSGCLDAFTALLSRDRRPKDDKTLKDELHESFLGALQNGHRHIIRYLWDNNFIDKSWLDRHDICEMQHSANLRSAVPVVAS